MRSFICLSKYFQGYDELYRLRERTAHLGNSYFIVLVDEPGLKEHLESVIKESFKDSDATVNIEIHQGGQCTRKECARLQGLAQAYGADVVVGVGGGKVLDSARAAAYLSNLPIVIVPTSASSDAPTSNLVIYYTEEGVFDELVRTHRNPSVVLMDTNILSKAPVRLLVAGMGDALSTYFEARTCVENYRLNYGGGYATLAAYSIAKLCYETLLADGVSAKLAAENKVVTRAFENIIEANTLMSGIGFECNGSSVAHAMHSGFSILPMFPQRFHGEWVAFGTLVLLVLEKRPQSEVDEVIAFCRSVGLPTTFRDLGIDKLSREDLFRVAERAVYPKENIHKEPFPVTADDAFAAMMVADAIGRRYQA